MDVLQERRPRRVGHYRKFYGAPDGGGVSALLVERDAAYRRALGLSSVGQLPREIGTSSGHAGNPDRRRVSIAW